MNLRPTTAAGYSLVHQGILSNQARLFAAQERIATGKRLLRASDDPTGTSRALALRRQLAQLDRYRGAIARATPELQAGASALEDGSSALAQVRELVLQGMNGTLSGQDRAALGQEVQLLLGQLVDVANARFGDRHLFAGSATGAPAYALQGGRYVYQGDDQPASLAVGDGQATPIGLAGPDLFELDALVGVSLVGGTGLALGAGPSQGSGHATLVLRHDATTGAPGSGIQLAGGGADDTLLGDHDLVVDATAGTVRLGDGQPVPIPDPSSLGALDLVVTDSSGAEVHLDVSGYDGTDSAATLSGAGSISLDGGEFQPLDLSQSDLQVVGAGGEVVLHLDATGVRHAGETLVRFEGRSSVFDVVGAIADDLVNADGLPDADVLARLEAHLDGLDAHHEQLLDGLGLLGARQARLVDRDERLSGVELELEDLRSRVEDADLTGLVLEVGKTEQTLELVQATGSRLIQTSLLNFLR